MKQVVVTLEEVFHQITTQEQGGNNINDKHWYDIPKGN